MQEKHTGNRHDVRAWGGRGEPHATSVSFFFSLLSPSPSPLSPLPLPSPSPSPTHIPLCHVVEPFALSRNRLESDNVTQSLPQKRRVAVLAPFPQREGPNIRDPDPAIAEEEITQVSAMSGENDPGARAGKINFPAAVSWKKFLESQFGWMQRVA
jgi:hypothetical protein